MRILEKLNRTRSIVWVAFLLSVGYLGWLATSIHEGIFFAGDQALKSMQVRQIAAGEGFKYVHLDQPDWVRSIWAQGYFPLRPPFFYPSPKGYLIVYPPLYQELTAFFYARLGHAGLYLLPMVCALLLMGGIVLVLKRCAVTPVNTALALLVLVFCSPLMLYGVMFWEHLPAVLLLFAGLSHIVLPRRRIRNAVLLGAISGVAVWLRPEALVMVLLYGAAVALLFRYDRRRAHIGFCAGAALTVLPWFLFNLIEYGALFGIHGKQVFSDNDPDTRMGWRHGWQNLTAINDISIRHFWLLLLLVPVLIALVRRRMEQTLRSGVADLRLFLLSAIVIAYSVITPFFLPNDGIIQWGPRYFLAIIPVALVALVLAEMKWPLFGPRAGNRTPRWLAFLAVLAICASFYRNTHGGGYVAVRYRYDHRLTDIYRTLARKPGNVVIVSPHYMCYDFGYIFDRNYFFGLTGDDSLRRLLPLLKKQGVHDYYVIYSPRYHTLPPMLRDSTGSGDTPPGGKWIEQDIAFRKYHID